MSVSLPDLPIPHRLLYSNCALWRHRFSLFKSRKDPFWGSVLIVSLAQGEQLQSVKGEISVSPLAHLPGLESVMSVKKISACPLLGQAAFSLLWPAPGGPGETHGQRNSITMGGLWVQHPTGVRPVGTWWQCARMGAHYSPWEAIVAKQSCHMN